MGIEKILIVAAVATYFIADTFTTIFGVFLGVGAESNNMYTVLGGGSLMGIILFKLGLTLLLVGTATVLMFTHLRNEGISALIAIFVGGVLATFNNIVTIFTGSSLFGGWMGLGVLGGQYIVLATMLLTGLISLVFLHMLTFRYRTYHTKYGYQWLEADEKRTPSKISAVTSTVLSDSIDERRLKQKK